MALCAMTERCCRSTLWGSLMGIATAPTPLRQAFGLPPPLKGRQKKPPQLMLRRFAILLYFTYHRSATWTQEAFWPVTKVSPRWMLWASTVLPLTWMVRGLDVTTVQVW